MWLVDVIEAYEALRHSKSNVPGINTLRELTTEFPIVGSIEQQPSNTAAAFGRFVAEMMSIPVDALAELRRASSDDLFWAEGHLGADTPRVLGDMLIVAANGSPTDLLAAKGFLRQATIALGRLGRPVDAAPPEALRAITQETGRLLKRVNGDRSLHPHLREFIATSLGEILDRIARYEYLGPRALIDSLHRIAGESETDFHDVESEEGDTYSQFRQLVSTVWRIAEKGAVVATLGTLALPILTADPLEGLIDYLPPIAELTTGSGDEAPERDQNLTDP